MYDPLNPSDHHTTDLPFLFFFEAKTEQNVNRAIPSINLRPLVRDVAKSCATTDQNVKSGLVML